MKQVDLSDLTGGRRGLSSLSWVFYFILFMSRFKRIGDTIDRRRENDLIYVNRKQLTRGDQT